MPNLLKINALRTGLMTSIALGIANVSPASAATMLEATLEFSTPGGDPEIEDEIDFKAGDSGSQAAVKERIDGSDTVTEDFVSGGGSTDDAGPDDYNAVFFDETVIPFDSFHASGSALARFDRLATDAFWFSSQGPDGEGAPNGYIRSEAQVDDEITVSGSGSITFEYLLSGSISAFITRGDNDDTALRDVGRDIYTRFAAEFRKLDGAGSAGTNFRLQQSNSDRSTVYNDSFSDEVVTMSIDVEDGDLVLYSAKAASWISFDNEFGVTRNYARTDFGSTAVLSSVFLSDGVGIATSSNFDYLSVNNTDTDPEDPVGVVPLPAGAWLLLSGLIGLGGLRRMKA